MLNNSKNGTVNQVNQLAVAIANEGKHVGILYKDREDSLYLLHLCWHYKMKKESPSKSDFWIQASFTEDNQYNDTMLEQIATYCEMIADANQEGKIPYGIGYTNEQIFDSQGHWCCDPDEGLTCATFVMAIFDSWGLTLLNRQTWPLRPEDIIWQQDILEKLKRHAPEEYLRKQKQKIATAARFRPMEVAAGAWDKDSPINFSQAELIASKVHDEIRKLN